MDLHDFFPEKQIIQIKANEKQLVLKEMVEKLEELGLIENKDRYYAQIVHRESLENTGIGNGFAIPHARTESVSNFISILGICEEGIDYQAYDEKPVNYILLSIFPSDLSTKYLYLIGMMARIFSNDEKKKLIDDAESPEEIYKILQNEVNLYFDTISEKDETDLGSDENLAQVPSSDLDLLIRLERLYELFDRTEKSEAIEEKIKDIKKLIDNRSLTYYRRMRKKHANPFAIVEKMSCTGCHMEIPPIYIQKIQKREGISLCPNCGRFLILV